MGREHAALAVPSSLVTIRPVSCSASSEGAHLGQGVLAGVAVDYQQHLVRGAGLGLGDHAADF